MQSIERNGIVRYIKLRTIEEVLICLLKKKNFDSKI